MTKAAPVRRAREREDDVHDVQDPEAEEHPDLGEIARRAAHDLAGRHLPVERRPEAVEAVQEDGAELVFGVASGVEDEPATRDAGDEGDEREPEDESGRPERALRIGAEDAVDRALREPVDPVHRQLKRGEHRAAEEIGREVTLELASQRGRQLGRVYGTHAVTLIPRMLRQTQASRGRRGVP